MRPRAIGREFLIKNAALDPPTATGSSIVVSGLIKTNANYAAGKILIGYYESINHAEWWTLIG